MRQKMSKLLGSDAAPQGRAVMIRIKDPVAAVKSQGAVASGFASLMQATGSRDTLERTLYGKIKDQIDGTLRDKGIAADVAVVEPVGYQPVGLSPLWTDLGFMVAGSLLGWWLSARFSK